VLSVIKQALGHPAPKGPAVAETSTADHQNEGMNVTARSISVDDGGVSTGMIAVFTQDKLSPESVFFLDSESEVSKSSESPAGLHVRGQTVTKCAPVQDKKISRECEKSPIECIDLNRWKAVCLILHPRLNTFNW
jgi:hypothetical protein